MYHLCGLPLVCRSKGEAIFPFMIYYVWKVYLNLSLRLFHRYICLTYHQSTLKYSSTLCLSLRIDRKHRLQFLFRALCCPCLLPHPSGRKTHKRGRIVVCYKAAVQVSFFVSSIKCQLIYSKGRGKRMGNKWQSPYPCRHEYRG